MSKVERNDRVLREKTFEPIWLCPQITIGRRKARLRVENLHRLSILQLKGCAQRFVATSDLFHRTDQRAVVDCAFQPDGRWDVVCRRRTEAIEEPQPALSKR